MTRSRPFSNELYEKFEKKLVFLQISLNCKKGTRNSPLSIVNNQLEPYASTVNGYMFRIIPVQQPIDFFSRNTASVEESLVLHRAEWHLGPRRDRERRDFLSVDHSAELKGRVGEIGSSGSLILGRMLVECVESVVVRVDHDWRALAHVDKLLPPVSHIIRREPRLQSQISLKASADSLAEPLTQKLQFLVLLVAQNRLHRQQMLSDGIVEIRQRKTWKGALEAVKHRSGL